MWIGRFGRGSSRGDGQELPSLLKQPRHLFLPHAGKVLEKIAQAAPGFQISPKRIRWYPGSNKNRSAVHDVGIGMHNLVVHPLIISLWSVQPERRLSLSEPRTGLQSMGLP